MQKPPPPPDDEEDFGFDLDLNPGQPSCMHPLSPLQADMPCLIMQICRGVLAQSKNHPDDTASAPSGTIRSRGKRSCSRSVSTLAFSADASPVRLLLSYLKLAAPTCHRCKLVGAGLISASTCCGSPCCHLASWPRATPPRPVSALIASTHQRIATASTGQCRDHRRPRPSLAPRLVLLPGRHPVRTARTCCSSSTTSTRTTGTAAKHSTPRRAARPPWLFQAQLVQATLALALPVLLARQAQEAPPSLRARTPSPCSTSWTRLSPRGTARHLRRAQPASGLPSPPRLRTG